MATGYGVSIQACAGGLAAHECRTACRLQKQHSAHSWRLYKRVFEVPSSIVCTHCMCLDAQFKLNADLACPTSGQPCDGHVPIASNTNLFSSSQSTEFSNGPLARTDTQYAVLKSCQVLTEATNKVLQTSGQPSAKSGVQRNARAIKIHCTFRICARAFHQP